VQHPVNSVEDVLNFNVQVSLSDGVNPQATGTLSIRIEDDMPSVPAAIVRDLPANPLVQHNVMFILDISGSMDTDALPAAGVQTRLSVAKDAMTNLINTYDGTGDVMVSIVTFNETASAVGGVWMTATAAKTGSRPWPTTQAMD